MTVKMTNETKDAEIIRRLSKVSECISSAGFNLASCVDGWYELLEDIERELFGLGVKAPAAILPHVENAIAEIEHVSRCFKGARRELVDISLLNKNHG